MNNKERLKAVFEGRIPDRVPHFELFFQIPEQAFGKSWPSSEQMDKATPKEREYLLEEFFDIWERILERYNWAAVQMPESLHGYFNGRIIPEGRKRFGDRAMIYTFNSTGTTFMMPTGSEMVEFYRLFYEEPEKAHAEARRKVKNSSEMTKRLVDQGAEFIFILSDMGYNEGPFLSPQMFSEFVTPYLTEIVAKMHDCGTKVVLHSDGDLRKILGQLVSTGIDGYQSIDPQGHMDIAEVKKEYGDRLILMGNVKTALLQEVDDSLIRESVQYSMTHGTQGGRYIFSTSNCIFDGMPLESYHIMLDEYEKLAKY